MRGVHTHTQFSQELRGLEALRGRTGKNNGLNSRGVREGEKEREREPEGGREEGRERRGEGGVEVGGKGERGEVKRGRDHYCAASNMHEHVLLCSSW